MKTEQKAVEILRVIAQQVADGGRITISQNWFFGTGRFENGDGFHACFGHECEEDDRSLDAFIDGLHEKITKMEGEE